MLSAIAVWLPAVLSAAVGSFSIPRNDDWAYRRPALLFAHTGHLVFTGWSPMTLVGQLVWAWPFLRVFGSHGWVFATSTAVLATFGVAAAYYVARHVLERLSAGAAVALLAAFPGFAWSTSTFQTDAPAFAAEMGCLALGVAALGRRGRGRWALLVAAMAVGAFGFAIREFVLAAPLAVLLSAAATDEPRRRARYVVMAVAELAACAGIYMWTRHIPGMLHVSVALPSRASVLRAIEAYFTMAFVLSPVVMLAWWRRLERQRVIGPGAAVVATVLAGVFVQRRYRTLFVGNILQRQGAFGHTVLGGGRSLLVPGLLWHSALIIGLISGGLLMAIAAMAVHDSLRTSGVWRWETASATLCTFAGFLALGLVLYALTADQFFDRYLWPLTFALAVLLLRIPRFPPDSRVPRPILVTAMAVTAVLVVITAMLTVNADSYDAARWHAGQVAVSSGVPSSAVDAGFEWVGAHTNAIANLDLHPAAPAYEPWYAAMEYGFRECAVVSASPLASPQLRFVKAVGYRTFWVIGHRSLYVYVRPAPGC